MKIDLSEELGKLSAFCASTNSDKYAQADLDMGGILSSPDRGARFFTAGNAAKYLSRYLATEGAKNYQEKDLLKACHYLLFELRRRKLVELWTRQAPPEDPLPEELHLGEVEAVRGQLAEDIGESRGEDYPAGLVCSCASCTTPDEARPEFDPLPDPDGVLRGRVPPGKVGYF